MAIGLQFPLRYGASFAAFCRQMARAERHRWPLWLPVALGGGAALYFAWGSEPPLWFALAALALAVPAGLGARRWFVLGLVAALALALALGFAIAKLRQEQVAAPVLDRTMVTHFTGRIESLDWRDNGVRVVIGDLRSAVRPFHSAAGTGPHHLAQW